MKRGVRYLFFVIILISNSVYAALPYRESLEMNDFKINKVQCSDNQLRVLVESKSDLNLNIIFKIYSANGNINIFSEKILPRRTADYFLIDTNLLCRDLLRMEINGYANVNNEKVVYINSELSYKFTGKEELIPQEITPAIDSIESVTYPISNSYVYINDQLLVSFKGAEETYYAHDQIGSNSILTDANGDLIKKIEYEPFGRDAYYTNERFKFTGKEQDNSGLYYYGARYYDNNLGRFISADPEFKADESSYIYANNNPLIYNDPNGAMALKPKRAYAFVPVTALQGHYPRTYAMLRKLISSEMPKILNVQKLKMGTQNIKLPDIVNLPSGEGAYGSAPGAYRYNIETNQIGIFTVPSLLSQSGKIVLDIDEGMNKLLLAHEMGHYTFDMFLESKGIKRNKLTWGENFIHEGVAEYLRESYFTDKGIKSEDYASNLALVKPLITKYGPAAAQYLFTHPPNRNENLKDYDSRMSADLDKQNKK